MKKTIYVLFFCMLIVTGIMVFKSCGNDTSSNYSSSKEYSSSSGSSGTKTGNHTCYVCGKTGNLKYGSFYYCSTHWAMVKTITEAD